MNKKLSTLLMVLALIVLTTQVFAQQILDPANYITVANLNDNNTLTTTAGTNLCDTTYCEVRPTANTFNQTDGWWSNVGATWFGGSHRRSPRTAGSPNGASATYFFNVAVSDHYLVYHYMGFTGNASTFAYVTFKRFGEGVFADSFRYSRRYYASTGSRTSDKCGR